MLKPATTWNTHPFNKFHCFASHYTNVPVTYCTFTKHRIYGKHGKSKVCLQQWWAWPQFYTIYMNKIFITCFQALENILQVFNTAKGSHNLCTRSENVTSLTLTTSSLHKTHFNGSCAILFICGHTVVFCMTAVKNETLLF